MIHEGLPYRADGKTRVNQNICLYHLSKYVEGGGTEALLQPDGTKIVVEPESVMVVYGYISAIDTVYREVLTAKFEAVFKRDHLNNTSILFYESGFVHRDNNWIIQPATFDVYVDDVTEEIIVELDDGFARNSQWDCVLTGIKSKL